MNDHACVENIDLFFGEPKPICRALQGGDRNRRVYGSRQSGAKGVGGPWGRGRSADDQAQQLAELIQRRRGRRSPVACLSALATAPRYFIQRSPEQRSPDRRASLLRRREHCGDRTVAAELAAGFTTGELAVLKVISDEWLAHGACDRSLNELAARAGVCHSLAKRAVRLAELRWPVHGTAPAAVGAQAPHQHHPHYPRRMARLARTRAGARPTRSTPATGPSRSLRKLEGYKITRHGHRFSETAAAIVWIRPWRREIGQALVAPDVIFRKTALRAGALQ